MYSLSERQAVSTGVILRISDMRSPDGVQGDEITFMRKVANSSFRYASSIQDASESGSNEVEYPSNSSLATNLSIVAQLIKGGLGTSIYHLSIGGFDTHANQLSRHSQLLAYIAEAVSAFRSVTRPVAWRRKSS